MDKESQLNLLLAIVLSTLVFVGYSYWTQKTRQQEQEQMPAAVPTEQQEPAVPVQPSVATPSAPEQETPAQTIAITVDEEAALNAEDVEFETPLVRATFTTLGGRLKQLELKNYDSKASGYVKLVPYSEQTRHGLYPFGVTIPFEPAGIGDLPNKVLYTVEREEDRIAFTAEVAKGLWLEKSFRFRPDSYLAELDITLRNSGEKTVFVGEDEKPSYELNWEPGILEPALRGQRKTFRLMTYGEKFSEKGLGRLKEDLTFFGIEWVGVRSRYFLAVILPKGKLVDAVAQKIGDQMARITIAAESCKLAAGEAHTDSYLLYMGPKDKEILQAAGHHLERAVYFGMFNFFGDLMLRFMKLCYKVVPNYGVAIIVLTIVVRMLLYPLTRSSFKSMKRMRELQPKMQELRDKYKNNQQDLNKKMMEMYKKEGVNPMGGCLPMLAQFPVWIALFTTLREAIELRGAPFVWWIKDMSEPDKAATLPTALPFLGDEVNLLPLLMMGSMLLQQKLMTPPGGGGQQDSQKMMMLMMPIMFGFLFYHMPAGLCLYIFVSTMIGFAQQMFVNKGWSEKLKAVVFKRSE